MEIIMPSIRPVHEIDGLKILAELDSAARTCYKSEGKMTPENLGKVVRNCIKSGHTSVLEHVQLSFIVTLDNGILREWTRHRIASYSVESTRYCNYGGGGMKFVAPIEFRIPSLEYVLWEKACEKSEEFYNHIIKAGRKPQDARGVLNFSVGCEMRFSANIRSLRNLLSLRCDKAAHAHMKEICIPLLLWLQEKVPILFDDIEYDKEFYDTYLANDIWRGYIIDTPADNEWNDIVEAARVIWEGDDPHCIN